jgi:hypothetical protein
MVGMAEAWNTVWNVWRSAGRGDRVTLMVTKRAKAQKVKASHEEYVGGDGRKADDGRRDSQMHGP